MGALPQGNFLEKSLKNLLTSGYNIDIIAKHPKKRKALSECEAQVKNFLKKVILCDSNQKICLYNKRKAREQRPHTTHKIKSTKRF